jgi:hypothetical protein
MNCSSITWSSLRVKTIGNECLSWTRRRSPFFLKYSNCARYSVNSEQTSATMVGPRTMEVSPCGLSFLGCGNGILVSIRTVSVRSMPSMSSEWEILRRFKQVEDDVEGSGHYSVSTCQVGLGFGSLTCHEQHADHRSKGRFTQSCILTRT